MKICLLGLLYLLVATTTAAGLQESYTYTRQTGSTSESFRLTYQSGPPVRIETLSETINEQAEADAKGATRLWRMTDTRQRLDIEIIRQENRLYLSGTRADEKLLTSIAVDDAPWYQFLSWSLRPFLRADQSRVEFWSVRPSTLKAYKMQAINKGLTTITIDGQATQAFHVEIRPTGVFAKLWKGNYWFDATSLVFLRYQAVHGPPGSPETRIEVQG